eukprot:Lankesteria_metandrocarpae@DN2606_c0_g1_i1.p1
MSSNTRNTTACSGESIKVYVRIRPPNKAELTATGGNCSVNHLALCGSTGTTTKLNTTISAGAGGTERTFNLDGAFPSDASQKTVYDLAALPIVEAVLEGFNGTVLAYGQTGTGKTHTIEGMRMSAGKRRRMRSMDTAAGLNSTSANTNGSSQQLFQEEDNHGVIPRMVHTVFSHITAAESDVEFQIKLSICELYMERIRDLLVAPPKAHKKVGAKNPHNLRIRENPKGEIYIEGLSDWYVSSPEEIFEAFGVAQNNRTVSETNMNAASSRSHLIFILTVVQASHAGIKMGKLYLVDLAGSEKVSKSGADGVTLEEAKQINKSLSALGNVINALTSVSKGRQAAHVPYRSSKLTRALQESLGGNSKTCLICTVSPSELHDGETLSTLRFGQRAKQITNAAHVNQELTVDELKKIVSLSESKLILQAHYIAVLRRHLTSSGASVPSIPTQLKNEVSLPPHSAEAYDIELRNPVVLGEPLTDSNVVTVENNDNFNITGATRDAGDQRTDNACDDINNDGTYNGTGEDKENAGNASIAGNVPRVGSSLEEDISDYDTDEDDDVVDDDDVDDDVDDDISAAGLLSIVIADADDSYLVTSPETGSNLRTPSVHGAIDYLTTPTTVDSVGNSFRLHSELYPKEMPYPLNVDFMHTGSIQRTMSAPALSTGNCRKATAFVRQGVNLELPSPRNLAPIRVLTSAAVSASTTNLKDDNGEAVSEDRISNFDTAEESPGRRVPLVLTSVPTTPVFVKGTVSASLGDLYEGTSQAPSDDVSSLMTDPESIKSVVAKTQKLAAHLDQLTALYHNALNKNADLQGQGTVQGRELKRLDETVTVLKRELQESRDQYSRLLQRCSQLSSAMEGISLPKVSPQRSVQQNSTTASSAASNSSGTSLKVRPNQSSSSGSSWYRGGNHSNHFSFAGFNAAKRWLNITKPLRGGGQSSSGTSKQK